MERAIHDVAAEVGSAPPARLLAEAEARDPADLDAAPSFSPGIPLAWVVVGPATADDGHLVSTLDQRNRKITNVLRRCDNVRVERLIKKEDLQRNRVS